MEGKISSQNLIEQVKVESVIVQPGFYRQIVFDVLTVISAALFGYVYRQYLVGQASFQLLLWVIVGFSVFTVLQTFLAKEMGRRFFILLLEIGALLAFFYDFDLKFLGAAAGIMLVFSLWGDILGRRELENSLQIRFFRTAKPILKKLTTALALLLIVLYLPQWHRSSVFVPEETFQGFFDWAANLTSNFYPNISFNSSFGALTEDLAAAKLAGDPLFRELQPSTRASVLKETADQVAASLSESLGIDILAEDSVSGVFYDFIVKLLEGWRDRFQDVFLFGWVAMVFFILRGFGIIFYWVVGFLAFIVYQILLASGFMRITGETRTHEIIEY